LSLARHLDELIRVFLRRGGNLGKCILLAIYNTVARLLYIHTVLLQLIILFSRSFSSLPSPRCPVIILQMILKKSRRQQTPDLGDPCLLQKSGAKARGPGPGAATFPPQASHVISSHARQRLGLAARFLGTGRLTFVCNSRRLATLATCNSSPEIARICKAPRTPI
jgi:hypothetical protein